MSIRLALLSAALFFASVPFASATIPATLYAPANCVAKTTAPVNFVLCDDGVPAAGGTTVNVGGLAAITVPAEYGGDGYTGLPAKKTPTTVMGADANDEIALDVDISWPASAPPAAGYPMLFFMHGCCGGSKRSWEASDFTGSAPNSIGTGGEQWHYNNAWFASRGYVVVTYTARGFATAAPNRAGSTGETQLDSRKYEINDYQSLACQIFENRALWNAATGQTIKINPNAVVVTGGSYGGGFSWMALTDPVWNCPGGQKMKLAAAAPKYGWTDLIYSLVPTGRHSTDPSALPKFDGCDSSAKKPDGSDCANLIPYGVPKQTINAGLYGTGKAGTGPGSGATTFPSEIDDAQACLTGPYPFETNPICTATNPANGKSPIGTTLPEFLADRSAYYQQQWFDHVAAGDADYLVPIFSAATLTDPLFPPHEHRRMHNRIRSLQPQYPLQAYFGDYQHFSQNKGKEWGDLCGSDRHICKDADFGSDFNANPATLQRLGITTRLNRFIDRYARPAGDPSQPTPSYDVTAALQVCPQKATATQAADEPGDTFTAATFEALSNNSVTLDSGGAGPTLTAGPNGATLSSSAGGGTHADPVATDRLATSTDNHQCPTRTATDPAPPGVAQFTTTIALATDVVMLGSSRITVAFTPSGDDTSVQLNARLYELLPSGDAVMADRGFRRLSQAEVASGTISFELSGNGWKFTKDNKIRLELAQDDSPYLKASAPPASLDVTRVTLVMPTRFSGGGGGVPPPAGGGDGGGGTLALGLLGALAGAAALRRRTRRG